MFCRPPFFSGLPLSAHEYALRHILLSGAFIMIEMLIYVVTVGLAVYGLSCFVRLIWSLIVRCDHDEKTVILTALDNNTAEFALRHSVELAKCSGIDRVAAVDLGLDEETLLLAKMYANGEPMVSIYDRSNVIDEVLK